MPTQTENPTDTAVLEPPAATDEPSEGVAANRPPSVGEVERVPGTPATPRATSEDPASEDPGSVPKDSASPSGDGTEAGPRTGTRAEGGRHDSAYAHILAEMDDDRRNLRRALVVALLFHLGLFFVRLPDLMRPMEVNPAAKQKAYVVQQVRFQPPQAAPQREIPDKKKRKIPIPDPTPDDPEPVRELEVDLPDLDYDLPLGELNLEIPEGPPGPPGPSLGDVLQVGGDVQAPVKLHAPRPGYTEEARQARIQGVVMLQVIVDTEGNVIDPKILKGLPMGLDQQAVETVRQWKFKPALRNGEPVPVYYNLTINFSLQ